MYSIKYLNKEQKKTACLADSHLDSVYAEEGKIITCYGIQSNNTLTFLIVEEEFAPGRSLKIQYPVPVHRNCMEWHNNEACVSTTQIPHTISNSLVFKVC